MAEGSCDHSRPAGETQEPDDASWDGHLAAVVFDAAKPLFKLGPAAGIEAPAACVDGEPLGREGHKPGALEACEGSPHPALPHPTGTTRKFFLCKTRASSPLEATAPA